MENDYVNIVAVAVVANALKPLEDQIVFVGGSILNLYVDDPAAAEARPTEDVDITIDPVRIISWRNIEAELRSLGMQPDMYGHALCRYLYKGIPIDIVPSEDGPMGPSNRWYKYGFDNLLTVKAEEQEIQILSAPCYLATKFEAFNDRGKGDYRVSHDFEDITYVLENRSSIVEEILNTHPDIKAYLKIEFGNILSNEIVEEILSVHLQPDIDEVRLNKMLENMKYIISN